MAVFGWSGCSGERAWVAVVGASTCCYSRRPLPPYGGAPYPLPTCSRTPFSNEHLLPQPADLLHRDGRVESQILGEVWLRVYDLCLSEDCTKLRSPVACNNFLMLLAEIVQVMLDKCYILQES
ncbi:uncharacterized protein LOC110434860 [Sorghum bicolor]|uniref:uncharacterized protein LOC110434860 n=1 Tax=Sorghum bicolor TaxID=4558 RepID=UPI000B42492F|nr:uncharacterized protein LOC110434860 [Sorghum bicolor]|eukprot:XP_021315296.1 uncharacterized protein LOC110434860 [Sorghum bicolor]